MQYMLLIYMDEQAMTPAERQDCYVESTQLANDLYARGCYRGCGPLQPVATAASIQVREGKRLVTDGPFAETREQLGGFFLIEAASREEALAIAERIPAARKGTVEVRPMIEVSGLPEVCFGEAEAVGKMK